MAVVDMSRGILKVVLGEDHVGSGLPGGTGGEEDTVVSLHGSLNGSCNKKNMKTM